jgi:hypothetical protein
MYHCLLLFIVHLVNLDISCVFSRFNNMFFFSYQPFLTSIITTSRFTIYFVLACLTTGQKCLHFSALAILLTQSFLPVKGKKWGH